MNTITLDRPRPEVVVITLDRPERLNAITFELVDELHAVLDDLDRDNSAASSCSPAPDAVSAPASTSRRSPGRRFGRPDGTAAGLRSQAHIAALVPHLAPIPQPVIAAVNGPAYGGGLALACGCDIRVAAAVGALCVQFIKVGLGGCDIGISYTLPRLVGASRAHDLILTGRVIDAAEAERIGLVSRVVPDGEALDAALEIADTLVRLQPVRAHDHQGGDVGQRRRAEHREPRSTSRTAIRSWPTTTGDIGRAVTAFTQRSSPTS